MHRSALRRRAVRIPAAALASVVLAAIVLMAGSPSLSISAYAQPTPSPSAQPTTIDERVEKLEEQVEALSNQEKDIWDKLEASGPLIGGVLVAIIGAFATIVYNSRQQRTTDRQASQELRVNRVQTLGELMPFLSSQDPRQVEAALVSIAELGDPELASSMAVIYKGEGGVEALQRLADGPNPAIAETARATLVSVFEEVRRSVAVIVREDLPVGMAVFVETNTLVAPNFVVYASPQLDGPATALTARVREEQGHIKVIQRLGDRPHDLAVLTSEVAGTPVRIGNSDKLTIGDRVTIAGLTSEAISKWLPGHEPQIQVVSAAVEGLINDGRIKLSGVQITPGYGGGPVFDASGVMVGIIVGTNSPLSPSGGSAISANPILSALPLQSVT